MALVSDRSGCRDQGVITRNQPTSTVVKCAKGAVNGHVTIQLGEKGTCVSGSITNEAIDALGLAEGVKATVIIKSTDVMVAAD